MYGPHVVHASAGESVFEALPCSGELAPDSAWSTWSTTGNLDLGTYERSVWTNGSEAPSAPDPLRTGSYIDGPPATTASLPSPSGTLQLMNISPGSHSADEIDAMAVLLRGLSNHFTTGHPTLSPRATQVPRVSILGPTSGKVLSATEYIQLHWDVAFERFDAQPYEPTYPAGFAEPESDLAYAAYFSLDDGITWYDALTGIAADPTKRPETANLLYDSAAGPETQYLLFQTFGITQGDVLLRVVGYHTDRMSHTTHHQIEISLR